MRLKGFVYIIGNDELGVFKIGYSRNYPTNRLHYLQVGSPVILRLAAFVHVDNAPETEKKLHERFSEQHLHHEWFRLSPEDIRGIGLTMTSAATMMKVSQPRTLSKQEAKVVLTMEEQGRKEISRQELLTLLGTGEKSVDNVIESLRDKGWLERVSWGHYNLIPFSQGQS